MKRLGLSLIASAVFMAFAFTAPANAAPKTIKWRIQTAVPAASMYMDIIKSFGANIDAMSGGRLKTEVLPVGMTSVKIKIEVIVFDSNDQKQHVGEVCANTLTRRECACVHVNSAAHRQNGPGCRAA